MSKNDYVIRLEREEDYREVENLTREAFWNVYRPGCTEHYVLHCYRDRKDFIPELDLVMEKDHQIIGHVMYVHSEILMSDRILPIMTFGPISILPQYQRQGYGKVLLDDSMERAKSLGCGAIAICGNIAFYGKSGFVLAKEKGINYAEDPEADYFLIKELVPGFLEGVTGEFKDPSGYFVAEENREAFEAFDAQFPEKRA
ncbi:MAG: N-acetyltransferase [Hespellia sp.]|jgi:putative acetyltransferase|nr:N-acetyltransferase [Hespellia sp.]